MTIWRELVYAYFTEAGRTVRLRLSADECDRLDLFEVRQIFLGFDGREPARALMMAVAPAPPFVWVELAGLVNRAG